VAVQLRRTLWRLAEVIEVVPETLGTKSLLLEVPGCEGHKPGQHVDVRLTAEDGYQTQRSYSIASAPEDERLMLTVDRLDDGEVSIYLTDVIRHRAAAGSDVPTRLLYSSRSYEEIIYREELETLASRDSALEVIHTLTRSRPQGWTGYDRRIDAEMLWLASRTAMAVGC
jgi:ferredoxin-NADP reductase